MNILQNIHNFTVKSSFVFDVDLYSNMTQLLEYLYFDETKYTDLKLSPTNKNCVVKFTKCDNSLLTIEFHKSFVVINTKQFDYGDYKEIQEYISSMENLNNEKDQLE